MVDDSCRLDACTETYYSRTIHPDMSDPKMADLAAQSSLTELMKTPPPSQARGNQERLESIGQDRLLVFPAMLVTCCCPHLSYVCLSVFFLSALNPACCSFSASHRHSCRAPPVHDMRLTATPKVYGLFCMGLLDCDCVWTCLPAGTHILLYPSMYISIYIYIHVYIYMCTTSKVVCE